MKNRLEFPAHLVELGLTGEGVEVGVLFGEYSQCLLSNWPGTLHLVDPWEQQSAKVYRDGCNAVDMDEALADTMDRIAPFGDRARVHRMYSVKAAKKFKNGQLDFVYIDANHKYDAVVEDMQTWWPKLKDGGILCGHDHYTENSKFLDCGVLQAVNEFALAQGLKLHVTPDCTSWWITKAEAKPLIAVLGVSHKDLAQAEVWLRWAAFLNAQGGKAYTLVVSCTQRITIRDVERLELAMDEFPHHITVKFRALPDEHEHGYPGSASHLFLRSLEYVEEDYPGHPILWLECDTAPMVPNWVQHIQQEYLLCNAPFMGYLEHDCNPPHMAGVAVYPHNWRTLAPKLANVLSAPDNANFGPGKGQAFDTYAADEVYPQAAQATTIQQLWKPTWTGKQLLAMIDRDTVLFHQCKDASLIHEVAAQRYPNYLELAE